MPTYGWWILETKYEATSMRDPISAGKVTITIWYLANTTSYRVISQVFGAGLVNSSPHCCWNWPGHDAELHSPSVWPKLPGRVRILIIIYCHLVPPLLPSWAVRSKAGARFGLWDSWSLGSWLPVCVCWDGACWGSLRMWHHMAHRNIPHGSLRVNGLPLAFVCFHRVPEYPCWFPSWWGLGVSMCLITVLHKH